MSHLSHAEFLKELKQFASFKDFSEEMLSSLAQFVVPYRLSDGQSLLEQGQLNDSLYFLRQGRLKIEVDGQFISEINQPGDLIGEMSLIHRKPAAATVKAVGVVELFQVGEKQLQQIPESNREKFQQLLYKVYSFILSDRLVKTNDKAKRFEIAHKELTHLNQQLERVNLHLESEISRRSSELVQKVKNLTTSHLQPAQVIITQLHSQLSEDSRVSADLSKMQNLINEVVDFLQPVAEMANLTGATKRVLLFDANKKQQAIAKLALGGTGVDLTVASSFDDLNQLLNEEKYDLILCDASVEAAVQACAQQNPKSPLALITEGEPLQYLDLIKKNPQLNFFVSRQVEQRLFTIKSISTTVSKILHKDFFGVEKYLAWGAKIIEKPVQSSTQRAELIEAMTEHFRSFGLRSSLLDRVCAACEELLMNAIYDAPIDEKGQPLFNHLPRTEIVNLTSAQRAEFRYGTDGVVLAVSVRDPFGSLSKSVISKYLEGGYQGQEVLSDEKKGGAGRGLHVIIESSDLTIFNVQKSRRTEVICLFKIDTNAEESARPSFHLFFT